VAVVSASSKTKMAIEVDFSVDQGTTFQKNWTVFMDPTLTIQANLVGFTASMNVCYTYDTLTQVIMAYSTSGNNMTINTNTSMITVDVANTDFDNVQFPAGQDADSIDLVYDVLITAANTASYRVAQGTLTVNRAVTQ
jgi:hypothetical protein